MTDWLNNYTVVREIRDKLAEHCTGVHGLDKKIAGHQFLARSNVRRFEDRRRQRFG